MSYRGARAALALSSILFVACGAKTLDFTGPDGSATTTGSGGTGGTNPGDGATPGPFVTKAQERKASKIDLLFMIDNSSSMADKQVILGEAVPELVDRLIEPKCIDPVTGRTVGNAVNGVCPVASELEFAPINDIHIGVISSSLGSHGAAGVCDDKIDISLGRSDPHNDDRAHLVTRGVGAVRIPTFNGKGFLNYNPSVPGALTTAASVAVPFANLVRGIGQHGCGYEASLEAAYRFLIDPEPYDTISVDTIFGGHGIAVLNGIDGALLQQRADFLRPDSVVSVVLITDQNDCSIIDGGQGFYALLPPESGTGHSVLPRGTSKCLENPNDRCCFGCGEKAPDGCAAPAGDPECLKGPLLFAEDAAKLRCFNQKQRYGADFLYPVQRYIDGFSKPEVPNRRQEMVPNPLFADLTCTPGTLCAPARDKSLVFVTGIVGVPWQDIAVSSNDLTFGYKTARQLREENIWATIVGDPQNPTGPVQPRDPHMIESITPRNGLPGLGSGPRADPIHGHEWDTSKIQGAPNGDLQYACIFDLRLVKTCTEAADCDCFGPNLTELQNPVCQNQQGLYINVQARGKAYPSTRILQVLQGIGDQAIVGSICPANVTDKFRDDYGFTPTVTALIGKLRQPLGEQCLPFALPVDTASGQSPCSIIEVYDSPACRCYIEQGRRTAADALLTDEMKTQGNCRCEIKQLSDSAQSVCRTQLNPPADSDDGWCYVNPAQQSNANCDFVRTCATDQQRRIRFPTVNSKPRLAATVYIRCEQPPVAPSPSRCP